MADGSCINIYVGRGKRGSEEKDLIEDLSLEIGKKQVVSIEWAQVPKYECEFMLCHPTDTLSCISLMSSEPQFPHELELNYKTVMGIKWDNACKS